jgi:hypothetical protein
MIVEAGYVQCIMNVDSIGEMQNDTHTLTLMLMLHALHLLTTLTSGARTLHVMSCDVASHASHASIP